jgi:hypothetical protein
MKRSIVWLLAGLMSGSSVLAQEKELRITIAAGEREYRNVPLCVPLSVPSEQKTNFFAELRDKDDVLQAQITLPGLMTHPRRMSASSPHLLEEAVPSPGRVRRDLHFIIPHLKAGASVTYTVKLLPKPPVPNLSGFNWQGSELSFVNGKTGARRPVLRFMSERYDDSSPERRDRTYKVFHHLYDPAGKRFVTNGGQTELKPGEKKKLLYPHHRGLMFGFNRISSSAYKNWTADTWHCTKGTHQSGSGVMPWAGPVLGRQWALVEWYGGKLEDGSPGPNFAHEVRELTVYNLPGGTLVEFASRLEKNFPGRLKLDGDPQHAGFQFRASNDVADKTANQTYFLRPDGKGKPGETRNWPKDKQHVDLPWDAMSFVLDGKRYTVVYLNHPGNPKPSRFSERDYGRFGCYFEYELTKDRPFLLVHYRVWLQEGEMTAEQAQALSANFVTPPRARVE